MRISDWSSDVCSSDLPRPPPAPAGRARWRPPCASRRGAVADRLRQLVHGKRIHRGVVVAADDVEVAVAEPAFLAGVAVERQQRGTVGRGLAVPWAVRSEEHTSELQSLMRI